MLDRNPGILSTGPCPSAGSCRCGDCPDHDTGINGTGHCEKHGNGCHVMCQSRW
jgi:hypothetical protein